MKESKQYVQRNASNTFSSREDSNDSNWTSLKQGLINVLHPNHIEVTRTKSPMNESFQHMGDNQDQGNSSRFYTSKPSLQTFSIMKNTQYNKPFRQDDCTSHSPCMLENQTFQHVQPTFQNDFFSKKSTVGRKKHHGSNDVTLLEQQAHRCHVSAYDYYDDVQTRTRGEKNKKELVADNDSNDQTTDTSFKNCSFSPTPGRFNLNDVEGDLPADFPDFSPLPYDEYANASNNNGQTMPPQQHYAASNDVKRQKTHEMANKPTLGLPTFSRRSNYVTFLKEPYHTQEGNVPVHHDEQSIIPHLQEERNKQQQQHEYLPATLNFPYKDFVASTNNKTNESHLQLWCDEEEQSRLEKHFNPKWQFEFFSKFYTAGAAPETPAIFGPSKPSSSKETKNAVRNNGTRTSEENDEIVFVSTTSNTCKNPSPYHIIPKKQRKDHSNDPRNETVRSPSASSDILSHHSTLLEQTAMKLSAAMDDTDKTRDIIARIEMEMQVNRDEILKERIAYVANSSQSIKATSEFEKT